MTITDKLILNLKGEDELKEALSRCQPGEKVCFARVEATLDEMREDQAVLSVTNVEMEGGSYEEAAEEMPEAEKKMPIMMVLSKGKP